MIYVLTAAGHHANWLRLHNMQHQVEEVTTLLHQRAASVFCESIPIANFLEKREAMFSDGKHFRRTDSSFVNFGD